MKNLWISVCLGFLLFLVGCGADETSGSGNSDIIPVYTPPAGGAYYILAAGISQITEDEELLGDTTLSIQATSDEPTKFQAVLDGLEEDKTVFGITAGKTVNDAYHEGEEDVAGDLKDIRAVGFTDGAPIHIVVPAESSMESYADLKGKTIGVFPGSGPEALFKEILEVGYGYMEGEDYKLLPYGYEEVQQGIQDKSIEAGMLMGSVPSSLVRELQTNTEARVLTLDEEAIEKFVDYAPETMITNVEPGTYNNEEELKIPFVSGYIFTHKEADEDLVYGLLETMLEYPDEIQKIHPSAENITPENIKKGITIPFHEGAKKYFEEHGITD